MTDDRLNTQPRSVNDAILDGNIRHMVFLERFQGGLTRELNKILAKGDDRIIEIVGKYLSIILDPTITPTQRERALSDMEKELSEVNSKSYANIKSRAIKDFSDLARHEMKFQAQLTEKSAEAFGIALGVAVVDTISRRMVKNIVERSPVRDLTVPQWIDGMRDSRLQAIVGSVRSAELDDMSAGQVLRSIRGSSASGYNDGVLGKYRRSIRTFTTTAVSAVSTRAVDGFTIANQEIISGVQWVSVLDSRTSPVCIQRDGKIYAVGEGPRPPAHYNCRSRISHTLKGHKKPHEVDFSEWLSRQRNDVVEEVLGKTRSQLYLKGDLPVKDMIARDGRFILLDDLKSLEADAFDKAGLGV